MHMSHSGELGIDADLSEVNLFEGANFSPEFLKLVSGGSLSIVYAFIDVASFQNPNATLPTLTHEGKSYKSTAEVIDYLVSISSTKVAPETSITKVVHEERIDPNFSMVAAVRPSAITLMRLEYLIVIITEERRRTRPSFGQLGKRLPHNS